MWDVIWSMIQQPTVCGICSQSHGVERYRLNIETFKFLVIMITDRVVELKVSTTKMRLIWSWM